MQKRFCTACHYGMYYECVFALSLLTNLTIFIILIYIVYIYFRVKRTIDTTIYKMVEIQNHPLDEIDEMDIPHDDTGNKRERLAALSLGGQAKKFLGRDISVEQIERSDDGEINKLYNKYESRLGAAMTKTLSKSLLTMYSYTVGMVLPISEANQVKLVEDLESDPFVGNAISSFTCSLYHSYGMYLAPLTAVLTTVRYCDFNINKKTNNTNTNNNDGERSSDEDGYGSE